MSWVLHLGLLLCGVYAASPLCFDGQKDLVKGTRCRKYVECAKGAWYLKQCQIGQLFNPSALRCEIEARLECTDINTRCEEGRTFSHPGSDSLYYQCQSGRISTTYCGVGQVFDHETGHCHTIDILRSSGEIHIRNKRSTDPGCENYWKRRVAKSCKDYLECINGEEVKKTCPDCMNFDEVGQRCRVNMLLPCGPNSIMPTPTPKPSTTIEPPTEKPTTPTTPKPSTTTEPPTEKPTTPTTPKPSTTTEPPTEKPTTPTTSKPEPQPSPQPEPQPSPQPEPQPSPQPEPQPSPQPEPQPSPQPEPQPSPQPEPQSTPQPEPQTSPQPEPQTSPQPEPQSTPQPEPQSTPQSETQPSKQPEPHA